MCINSKIVPQTTWHLSIIHKKPFTCPFGKLGLWWWVDSAMCSTYPRGGRHFFVLYTHQEMYKAPSRHMPLTFYALTDKLTLREPF